MNMVNIDYGEKIAIKMSNQSSNDNKKESKKKKCHGNRKLQHFKRRCRAKGMNNETIEMLVTLKNSNKQIQYQHQEKMLTNTRSFSTASKFNEYQDHFNQSESTKVNLRNNSINQLASLLDEMAEKQWISSAMMNISQSKRMKYYISSSDYWKKASKLLPNYNKLSSQQFINLLSKSLHIYRDEIYQFLTNTNIYPFIQQHATLMCTYFQLKIEEDYWNYIANLSNIPVFNWLLQISKDVILRNSINWDQTKTKLKINDRQKLIQNKLQQIEIDLNIHLQQYPSNLIIENTTYVEHSIKIIFIALAVLIRNDLQLFYMNFERKKILVYFDIKDAYYVKLFYDFHPTEEQICTVQQTWRNKLKLCKRAIVHKKKDFLIHGQISNVEIKLDDNPSTIHNEKNKYNINNNSFQQNHLKSIDSYPSAIYSIIKARLDNIEQRAQHILQFMDNMPP